MKNAEINTTDVWEMLGALEEDQPFQVLAQLFARYEQRRELHPDDPEAAIFFQTLRTILAQVQSCNLNRR
ncbi:hypothetical protein [Desulfobulbus propionicus]|nr:hypothetical protein [Desulfobulbus propionicus]